LAASFLDVHSRRRLAAATGRRKSDGTARLAFRIYAARDNLPTMGANSGLSLALFEPDIAANAGAMLRTCACFGWGAEVIEPAGFSMDDSRFKRGVMDYIGGVSVTRHASWTAFEAWLVSSQRRLVLLTTKATESVWDFSFRADDVLLVGRESAGVPDAVAARADARLRIPVQPSARSLNVAAAAAIAIGEATRQLRVAVGANAAIEA
jgi:tRNA (cytidine/uridine-2'-O-)-methyltransferase